MWSKEKYNELFQDGRTLVVQVRPTAEGVIEQDLYADKYIDLKSFWNKAGKLVGYTMVYKGIPKIFTSPNENRSINSFLVLYSKKKPPKTELKILFDDQNIRLLGYKSGKTKMDYLLASRWRDK